MAESSFARGARFDAHDQRAAGDRTQRWDVVDLVVAVGLSALALLLIGRLVGDAMIRALPGVRPGSTSAAMVTLVAGFAAYLVAVVPLVLLLRIRHGTTLRDLGWRMPEGGAQWFLFALPITAGMLVLTGALGMISHQLMPNASNPQCRSAAAGLSGNILAAAVLLSVLAPIAEETLFRGFLYRWFEQRIPWTWAVVIAGVAFGGAHRILLLLLPLAAAGIVLCLAYRYSRSIWPGAMVHALNNGVALALLFGGGCQ